MSNIGDLVNLRQAVKSHMNRLNVRDKTQFEYVYQLAIEGLTEEIGIYCASTVSVAYLEVPDSKIVPLPEDYMTYSKIGINLGGQFWTLTLNNNMSPVRTYAATDLCEPEDVVPTPDLNALGVVNYVPHYYGGLYLETLYSIGGGFNTAYYKVDELQRCIYIQGILPTDEIILEYISTGIKANGFTMIPRKVLPALRAYLSWKTVENDLRVRTGDKMYYRQGYLSEISALNHINNSFTKDEYLDNLYKYVHQGVKR